jgi:DNA-binding MarR family transcriptional regulator
MASGSRKPGRTVTSKVLAILEAFENSRGALSLTDIAEKSGLPLSTAHRLVNELTDWGFLSREPPGRYQLYVRLWEIARNTGRQLRDAARLYVQDLLWLTGETAHLAVRAGHEVLYSDRVYGLHGPPRRRNHSGADHPGRRGHGHRRPPPPIMLLPWWPVRSFPCFTPMWTRSLPTAPGSLHTALAGIR